MGCDALYDARLAISGKDVALFDLATWKNGLAFKKIDFSDSGIPVIKIAELNNGIGSSTSFTRGVYSSDVKLQRGDFLFSWSGNPETSIDIFRFELEEGWLNQHIFKTTPNSSLVTGDYFFYLMKWLKPVFKSIASNKQTTGLGHITISDLKKIKVTVPAKDFQGKVAAILIAIDNKISLNAKLNGYLAELADSLFKRRFGELPDNASLSDVAEITMGQSPAGSSYNEDGVGTVFYQGRAEFGWRYPSQRLSTTEPKRMARRGDVLMSVRAPVGDLNIAFEDCCIGRGLAAIHSEHPSFCLYLMRSLHSKLDAFNGEGTVFGSINGRALKSLPIALPKTREIQTFEKEVSPIDTQIRGNELQSRLLVTLRDTLLPRLMSGEIDVSKVTLF